MPQARGSNLVPLLTLVSVLACAPDAGVLMEPAVDAPTFAHEVSEPLVVSGGFEAPESAAHDPVADAYYISNVGDLFSDANDGFISRLSPDGTILDLRWVEGDAANPLISPTGVMVEGRTLYIVDRTALRRYDLRTQSWLAPIALPDDGLFFNDVCSSGQGRIYVTGTDLSVFDGNLDAAGALYVVERGTASRYLPGADVGNPNGCLGQRGVTWVSFLPEGGVYSANPSGRVELVATTPGAGMIDGIVLAGGHYYFTTWEAGGVYRIGVNGRGLEEVFPIGSPASLEYDARRGQLIVPSLFGNEVIIVPIR
ncbi:MAG TPA: hypothetical protein VMN39_07980 [Longimicrobiaceae bacterium]|nr:hypothetical protein [Longimicrobiaceae bacterium]